MIAPSGEGTKKKKEMEFTFVTGRQPMSQELRQNYGRCWAGLGKCLT